VADDRDLKVRDSKREAISSEPYRIVRQRVKSKFLTAADKEARQF